MAVSHPDSPLPSSRPASFSGPTFDFETELIEQGHTVCGCDEAGRGPLAGPVTAAAVVLDPRCIPDGLNDSKKLNDRKRDALFDVIMEDHSVACVSLNAEVVDTLNIRAASLYAMELAVWALPMVATHALIDGNAVPDGLRTSSTALVKGDARSLSIAAASIIAKVMRDRQMIEAAKLYPQYGFEQHKGYPSVRHRELVADQGPCALHRKSFAPVRQALLQLKGKASAT